VTVDADLSVSLSASLGSLAAKVGGLCDRMDREWKRRADMADMMRSAPFGLNVTLSAGATTGTYFAQSPNLGPAAGYMWSVRALIAQGYTAGTVNVWRDNAAGEQFAGFPQAGLYTFGRGERLLWPMSQMVVTASGITGTLAIYGHADLFPSWYLAEYIG
jgi:hypothetical protein